MTSGWNTTDYCSVAELATQLRNTVVGDTVAMQIAVTAASRAVEQFCNRQFGLTGSAVARVYTSIGQKIDNRPCLEIDDLQTTVGLTVLLDYSGIGSFVTASTLGTDFDFWPYNAAANGRPYTHMVYRPNATSYLPRVARGVQVTGNFGWTTVPAVVKQATLIQAARFFVRRDSAYGIAGSPQLGSELRLLTSLDPDVAVMLRNVKRDWAASGGNGYSTSYLYPYNPSGAAF